MDIPTLNPQILPGDKRTKAEHHYLLKILIFVVLIAIAMYFLYFNRPFYNTTNEKNNSQAMNEYISQSVEITPEQRKAMNEYISQPVNLTEEQKKAMNDYINSK